MLFNSFEFFAFLAIVFALSLTLSRRAANRLLLVSSYIFYAAWDWRFCSLLALSTLVDFAVGRRLAATADPRRRLWLVRASLATNLSILGFFKYAGRKHWSNLKPSERESFTKLFVETLRWSYFEMIDLFTDETVEFEEPVAKKTQFYLLTYILSKGERIKVAYKLYKDKKNDACKAYDVEIEGVSMVKSYRSQYRDFLRETSF